MSAADFTPERLAELRGFDWGRVVVIDGRDSDTGELYRAVKYVVADVEVRSMLDAIEELQAALKMPNTVRCGGCGRLFLHDQPTCNDCED